MEYDLLADNILVKLLRADDEEALRNIYLRHWKPLYQSVLRKVRVSQIAEELVQNVFISLWEKRHTTIIQSLVPYLQTAVKYQALNYIKSIILHKSASDKLALQSKTEEENAETTLLISELSNAIDHAIKRLPEKTQQVFRLSRLENRSNSEISKSLEISEKAVEYHITRSLRLLRIELRDFMF